jgi:dihydrofolate reductase
MHHGYLLNNIGRVTWESIPSKFRPLKDRINIVISSTLECDDCIVCKNMDEALAWIARESPIGHVFCIGGARLYSATFRHPQLDKIFLTMVHPKQDLKLTTFMEPIPASFKRTESEILPKGMVEEGEFKYEFQLYCCQE